LVVRDEDVLGRLVALAAALVGSLGLIVWSGAWLAASVTGRRFEGHLSDGVRAAVALPGRVSDPASAWPPGLSASLPGPGVYWAGTALAACVFAVVAVGGLAVWRRLQRPGTLDRDRLGVDARARLARPADLTTLFVDGPRPGRFILGRFGRRLVATECRPTTQRARRWGRRRRQGDTGAVALVGPSRSGKTVAAVAGILEWDGPAILSSVKADLMASTIGWRARLGEVRVYDPLGLTPCATAGWSPLAQSGSITGARRAARSLLEAVADDGTENLGMWKNLAEYLMAGLFWVAANSDRDMATAVEWVLTQDRPRIDAPSEVDAVLRELLGSPDHDVVQDAQRALQYLLSVWQQDERPRSSIYVTAQAALGAFADPAIAEAARVNEIDIEWLLSGNNTVYVCSPLKDQGRLSPAFGGLVDDLMTQMYQRANLSEGGRLERRVLVVLDEAGNQRLEQLPNYASTVAGLGVQLVTIWQSVAQITRAYGKGAGIVLTNHLSKVFYAGLSDEDSLGYVAKVLGEEEVDARSLSGHWSALARTSVTDTTNRVSLVQAHCLRQMTPGDALLVHGTLPPAHIATRRYYDERSLARRARLPIPEHLVRCTPHRAPHGGGGGGHLGAVDLIDVLSAEDDELLSQLDALGALDHRPPRGAGAPEPDTGQPPTD
jgi:type IV secretion system protein VirD4